jgi:hypothetical protein
MTRKSRTAAKLVEPAANHDIQRVRVNGDGYDASGAYWGACPDGSLLQVPIAPTKSLFAPRP